MIIKKKMGLKNTKEIGEILNKNLYIPEYQREYAWEKSEIEEFCDDYKLAYNSQKEHFFGQIVIHEDKEKKRLNIIDGQQRIVTISILINCIRLKIQAFYEELVKQEESKELKDRVDDVKGEIHKCIGSSLNFHLHSENEFVKKVLTNKYEVSDYKNNKVNTRIRNCNEMINEMLDNIIKNTDLKCHSIIEIYERMFKTASKLFKVIYVETDDLEEAFVIFETLNARGRELETADLLKNYVLGKSSNNIQDIKKIWDEMMNNLNQSDVTTFLRYYWNSKNEFVRKKDLYGKIIKKYNNFHDIKILLDELKKYSAIYSSIKNPNGDNTCFENIKIIETLENLKKLKATTFYPIILVIKGEGYQEKYILEILEILEKYIFRNYTICNKNPNEAEVKFAEIARKIYNNELRKVPEIIKEITKDNVSDSEFYNAFKEWNCKTKEYIRYALTQIHTYYKLRLKNIGKQGLKINLEELKINKSNEEMHIEHIMPKSIGQWSEIVTAEEHDEYLWRLGNLALLGKNYNQKISNELFNIKKILYIESEVLPNRLLAKKNEWNIEEITKRQKKLAIAAKRIWKIEL